jgi:hypothetical protein
MINDFDIATSSSKPPATQKLNPLRGFTRVNLRSRFRLLLAVGFQPMASRARTPVVRNHRQCNSEICCADSLARTGAAGFL